VFGLYEGAWYRARVMDAHPQDTIVQYIDYGNLATLKNMNEMMPIPLDMKFDIVARDFVIDSKMHH
jgi:Tudor domain